jgi:hypothetical protein
MSSYFLESLVKNGKVIVLIRVGVWIERWKVDYPNFYGFHGNI